MQNNNIECACHSPEHSLHFQVYEEDGEFYVSVYLGQDGFFKRLWTAIKYVAGYKSKYGDFDCFMGNKDQAKKIRDMMNGVLSSKKKVKR
jgi:hypothetical protein